MASLAALCRAPALPRQDEEHAPAPRPDPPILSKDDEEVKKKQQLLGAPSMDGENVKEGETTRSNVAWPLEDLLPRLADDEEREKAKQLQRALP